MPEESNKQGDNCGEERERSEHHRRKSRKMGEFRRKHHVVNPVCQKNYMESAGPLQFKNFVNKFVKGGKDKEEVKPIQGYNR